LFLFNHGKNLVVVFEFFKRVVLNFLIGNDDYHLKNISIRPQLKSQGTDFLTPVYDSLNTEIYHPNHSVRGEVALLLFSDNGGFSDKFEILGFHSAECFNKFAIKIGLNEKVANSFYDHYEKNFQQINSLVDNSFLPYELKVDYKKVLADRLNKLRTKY
jgi:serine/threonine-protein kinase HipA